jgi:hypothetical protein
MRISHNHRVASHAIGNHVASAPNIRRWALVRLILGLLQMIGVTISVVLIVHSGITTLALASVIVTGMFTGSSMLLFQVWKRGQIPNAQSAKLDRDR